VIEGIISDLEPVLQEIFERDHKTGRNPCRHCIVKHKKSVFKLRVTMGFMAHEDAFQKEFEKLPVTIEPGLSVIFPIYDVNSDYHGTDLRSKINLQPIESIN
jgi:hypothetical protein